MSLASKNTLARALGKLLAVNCLFLAWAQCQSGDSVKATLEGSVINALNNRIVPRAEVVLRNMRKAGEGRSVRADDMGRFVFRDIDPGTYRLAADRQSYLSDNRKKSYQPVVEVSPGANIKDVVLRLLPSGVVSGTIVDEHSDPMQHIVVKLLAREYSKGRLRRQHRGTWA